MPRQDTDPVDLASSDSFPASDPPSWTGAHVGPPPHTDDAPVVQAEPASAARRAAASLPNKK